MILSEDSNWPKQPVVDLPPNTQGTDWLVGDPHGSYDLLMTALQMVDFDWARDRLIVPGDLIDRGFQCMEMLRLTNETWFYSLRGNHEQMSLDLHGESVKRTRLMAPGFVNFAANKFGSAWLLNTSNEERLEFMGIAARLPVAFNIETALGMVGLVHAEVPVKLGWGALCAKLQHLPLNVGVCDDAINSRKIPEMLEADLANQVLPAVTGVTRVFHGHVPLERPYRWGNRFYIDTGAFRRARGRDDGFLTIVRADVSDEVFDEKSLQAPVDGVNVIE